MDQSLIQTGEFVTQQELVLGEAARIQTSQREKMFTEKAQEIGAEYDQNFAQEYVPPAKGRMSRRQYAEAVQVDRARYGQQQEVNRNKYVMDRVNQSKAEYSKEEETRMRDQIKQMGMTAANNPMHQQNLNAIRNFQESNYAHMGVPEYMSLLMSGDTRALALAAQSRSTVDKGFSEASAADKETMRVKEASLIIIPNEDGTVSMTKGFFGAEEEARLVSGDNKAVLSEAQKAYESAGGNIAFNPALYAKEFTEKRFKQEGIEMTDAPVQAVIDSTGQSAFDDRRVSQEITKSFKRLANDPNFSFKDRNDAIVTEALENAGIKPSTESQYQYQGIVSDAYSMVLSLRDASFNSAATKNSINTKASQDKAYNFVVSKLHDFAIQTANNPDALARSMEKSQGTSDAMTAITMVGAEGRMDILNSLNTQDFKKQWTSLTQEQQFGMFTDKVLDHMMDSTRHLNPADQKHAMSVVNKLRNKNAMGQLGAAEPVVANEMNTLFGMFLNTKGVEYNAVSATAKEDFTKGVISEDIGGISTTATFNPGDDDGVVAGLEWQRMTSANPQTPVIAQKMGLMDTKGNIALNVDDTYTLGLVTDAYGKSMVNNPVYAQSSEGVKSEIDQMSTTLNNFEQIADPEERTLEAVFPGDEKIEKGDPIANRVGAVIKTNTSLASAWNDDSPDGARVRQAVLSTATQMAFNANTSVAARSRQEFAATAAVDFFNKPEWAGASVPFMTDSLDTYYKNKANQYETGNLTNDEVEAELEELRNLMKQHQAYTRDIDGQMTDQSKTWGYNSKNIEQNRADMGEFGAVMLKHENDLLSALQTEGQVVDAKSLFSGEVQQMQANNPWLKQGDVDLVRLDLRGRGSDSGGYGSTSTSSGTRPTRFAYYIVPKGTTIERAERGRQIPPDESISLRGLSIKDAQQKFKDIEESLFEL